MGEHISPRGMGNKYPLLLSVCNHNIQIRFRFLPIPSMIHFLLANHVARVESVMKYHWTSAAAEGLT